MSSTSSTSHPLQGNTEQRDLYWSKWLEAGSPKQFGSGGQGAELLDRVFGHSPFLSESALLEPAIVQTFVTEGAQEALDRARDGIPDAAASAAMPSEAIAETLRIARRRVALTIALADITGAWPIEKVLTEWSAFAGELLRAAAHHLLGPGANESGYTVIALGKLGARELNYSSDIDLVVFFDQQSPGLPDGARDGRAGQYFTRLTQRLIKLFQERTKDGYLFRVDLRLRPDPGSTPLAVSMESAELYYAGLAQNWERAVFIRARPIAGDIEAGERFLSRIAPFVWRRNLDFDAVRDVQAMLRQTRRGQHDSFDPAGFHLKLGSGGIRTIEFHLQTQQLVWGGRNRNLRLSGTADGLRALVEAGRLEASDAEDLIGHYGYLRTVENRVQMVRDEQTHTVPEDEDERAQLASFLGYGQLGDFEADLASHVAAVQSLTAESEDSTDSLDHPYGSLVFTGVDPDPETVSTLRRIGFSNPERVIAQIANWHRGRISATRSERGRALLTEITPRMLSAIGDAPEPEGAFTGFARFLESLNAGVELLAMFSSHPSLMAVVVEIMGSAPELGQTLTANPRLLDRLLDTPLEAQLPDPASIEASLDAELDLGRGDYQDDLDAFRRWAGELRFLVALRMLCVLETPHQAAATLTDIADIAIRRLMDRVALEFEAKHGQVPGGGPAFLALGKLGGQTILPGSDLDGVFFFDAPSAGATSDGEAPLEASLYFSRFANRLITGFTAHTAAGRLWEMDLRLRPHGRAGPLASPLRGYEAYLAREAWPVEKLALVRSRVVAGTPESVATLNSIIDGALTSEGEFDALAVDLLDLRSKIKGTHRPAGPFDVKHAPGGLLDLELLIEYLAVTTAQRSGSAIRGSTERVLEMLVGANVLSSEDADRLAGFSSLYLTVQTMLRITVGTWDDPALLPEPLIERICRATGYHREADLMDTLLGAQATVRTLIDQHIERAST